MLLSTDFEIFLPADCWTPLPQSHFYRATDGHAEPQATQVRLWRSEALLTVAFDCLHDPYWRQTTRRGHNTSLWEQEVFELFIAPGEANPTHYLELELNPNDALFVGHVANPARDCGHTTLQMVPYEQAGVTHRITACGPDFWSGEFSVPFSLVGGPAKVYRLNFFRIILLQPQPFPDWVNAPGHVSYQCWRPTMSGATPCFHRPDFFGTLRLV